MDLSERIQNLRKTNGLSQERFAEKMNVSRQAVSKWENGTSVPDTEKIILMSECFNVSIDYLLKGKLPDNIKQNNTLPYLLAATVIDIAGVIGAVVVWIETRRVYSVAIGLISAVIAAAIYFYSKSIGKCGNNKAFAKINVCFAAFIPFSIVYNFLCGILGGYTPLLSPVPLIGNSLTAYALFFVIYAAFCVFICLKGNLKSNTQK